MKKLTIGLLLAFFVFACSSNPTPPPQPSPSNTAIQKTANGKQIYASLCQLCHGADGKRGFGGATNLTTSALSMEETILVIAKGRNTMQAYEKQLDRKSIEAVAAYIMEFRK